MKLFTKRFIHKIPEEGEAMIENSEKAFKKLGLPKELWLELSKKTAHCRLINSLFKNTTTAFMAGVAVGWAEKNDKIK
jgi:hypothetical protein